MSLKQKKSILARAFLENPLFVLFPEQFLDLADPGTYKDYFFSYCHFHIAFKNVFDRKFFQTSCMGLKVPFWKN